MDPQIYCLGLVMLQKIKLVELKIGVGQLRKQLIILADGIKIRTYGILRHVLKFQIIFEFFQLDFFFHSVCSPAFKKEASKKILF